MSERVKISGLIRVHSLERVQFNPTAEECRLHKYPCKMFFSIEKDKAKSLLTFLVRQNGDHGSLVIEDFKSTEFPAGKVVDVEPLTDKH